MTRQTVTFTCAHCGKVVTKPKRGPSTPPQKMCSKLCRNLASAAAHRRPLVERFWEKVEKSDGCWLWTGAKITQRYGALNVDGVIDLAHRLMWKMAYGPIPDGLQVLHHCDNPPCVRPDHLFLGTQQHNVRDAIRKKRFTQNWTKEKPPSPEVKKLAIIGLKAWSRRRRLVMPPTGSNPRQSGTSP